MDGFLCLSRVGACIGPAKAGASHQTPMAVPILHLSWLEEAKDDATPDR